MCENKIDEFGKELMLTVRDISISNWEKIIDGKIKASFVETIEEKMKSFNDGQKEIVKWLIPQIVDETLHNFLELLENSENIEVLISENGKNENISHFTDGLSGELFTKDGWISRFSGKNNE